MRTSHWPSLHLRRTGPDVDAGVDHRVLRRVVDVRAPTGLHPTPPAGAAGRATGVSFPIPQLHLGARAVGCMQPPTYNTPTHDRPERRRRRPPPTTTTTHDDDAADPLFQLPVLPPLVRSRVRRRRLRRPPTAGRLGRRLPAPAPAPPIAWFSGAARMRRPVPHSARRVDSTSLAVRGYTGEP